MQMSPQQWDQNHPLGASLGEPGCWQAAADINFPQPGSPRAGCGSSKAGSLQGWSGQRAAPSEAQTASCRDGLASFCPEWATRNMTTGRPPILQGQDWGQQPHQNGRGIPQRPRFSQQ